MLQLIAQDTLPIGQEALMQGLSTAGTYSDTDPGAGFGPFLSGILSGVLMIAALMVLLYLLWGAIEYITSGGDKGKVEKARDKITQAVIGMIVLAASTAIFVLLQSFLGVTIIDFGTTQRTTGTGIPDALQRLPNLRGREGSR